MTAIALPALLLLAALPLQDTATVAGPPPAADAAVDIVIGQSEGQEPAVTLPPTDTDGPRAPSPPPTSPLRARVTVSAGSAPDTITVGDHFRALIRVEAPAGSTVEFPEFNVREPVEALEPLQVARDSLGAWLATYRLVAWTTTDSSVAAISFRVRTSVGESSDFRVRLPLPVVRSVLPADSALHVPRPARGVIPLVVPSSQWPSWLIPVGLLAVIAAVGMWLMTRRRDGGGAIVGDPRSRALARLAIIERDGLLKRGEIRQYHIRMSRVLRGYLAAAAGWGEDRTSSEILAHARDAGMDESHRMALDRLLRQADRIKFSGIDPVAASTVEIEEAADFGAALRKWITDWSPAAGAAAPAAPAEAA